MKIQLTLILLTIMVLALHTMATSRPHKAQTLIETTCKSTPNYRLCAATLKANPDSTTATDVADLGLMMVAAVKAKSREALLTIHNLQKRQPKLSQALQRCAEVYKAVYEGDVAVAEQVLRGNPKFAETAMAGVAVEADICGGAFQGVAVPPPLSGVNKVVHDLAIVARAIIRNLL